MKLTLSSSSLKPGHSGCWVELVCCSYSQIIQALSTRSNSMCIASSKNCVRGLEQGGRLEECHEWLFCQKVCRQCISPNRFTFPLCSLTHSQHSWHTFSKKHVHTIFGQKRLGVKWYKNKLSIYRKFPRRILPTPHDLVWLSLSLSSFFNFPVTAQYKWYKAKCHTKWQVCHRKPPLKARCAECTIQGGNLLSLLTLPSGLSASIGTLKLAAP